jgi:hypothetical protein
MPDPNTQVSYLQEPYQPELMESIQSTLTIPIKDAGVVVQNKSLIKSNLNDFKEKILGAMSQTQSIHKSSH